VDRIVLIAVALTASAGCYDPTLVDCAVTCQSSDHACPDGATCDSAGFCRVGGASGACGATVDARGSGSAGGCPMAPQGTACPSATPATPQLPSCYVECSPAETGTQADAFSLSSWMPASVGSGADETSAESFATGGAVWIGATAPIGSGAMPTSWMWKDGTPMQFTRWISGEPKDHGASGNCAVVTASGWASAACTDTHPFLIKSRPLP
jgi:hypothetical protein